MVQSFEVAAGDQGLASQYNDLRDDALGVVLTNSATARAAGDVVVWNTAADNAFTTTTTEADAKVLGVVAEAIANGAAGLVQQRGVCTVTVDAATARGQYLVTSTTAGKATPKAAFQNGVFAVALTAVSGAGSVTAALIPTGLAGQLAYGAITSVPNHDHTGDAGDGAQVGWEAVSAPTLTAAPGTDHSVSGITITLTAHETVNFGDVCFINTSGKAQLVDADAIATASGVVMALATIAADASGSFLLFGVARDETWAWTVGGLIYITVTGSTGNTLSQTAPTGTDDVTQIVGVAMHANRMLFMPNLLQVEHT